MVLRVWKRWNPCTGGMVKFGQEGGLLFCQIMMQRDKEGEQIQINLCSICFLSDSEKRWFVIERD